MNAAFKSSGTPRTPRTRTKRWTMCAAICAVAGAVVMIGAPASSQARSSSSTDNFASLPATMILEGTARDFRERTETGGHSDFERQPTRGFGHYVQMVADDLEAFLEGLTFEHRRLEDLAQRADG
ncbi:MAG: hypothetical protein K2X32_03850, partial [Phycisphaerales bacterium]|nr:hypothetical protein [Phycisphaerales bacterium]